MCSKYFRNIPRTKKTIHLYLKHTCMSYCLFGGPFLASLVLPHRPGLSRFYRIQPARVPFGQHNVCRMITWRWWYLGIRWGWVGFGACWCLFYGWKTMGWKSPSWKPPFGKRFNHIDSHEQWTKPGCCLGYIGDGILPISYTFINHCKDLMISIKHPGFHGKYLKESPVYIKPLQGCHITGKMQKPRFFDKKNEANMYTIREVDANDKVVLFFSWEGTKHGKRQ